MNINRFSQLKVLDMAIVVEWQMNSDRRSENIF
ncbi:uncharacterized protein METZ01_LOCUS77660 [marine metagenome]|uniref:Uncharacterized protein n=1 Tax=marine metagenome TaxID=408172 RepID=A0A381U9B7_9ZZZZ